MRRLKLMPDYFSYPLWDVDEPENIDPATLPVSDALRRRLEDWSDTFDAILNQDDPASSGFADEESERAFDAEGLRLWRDLASELGPEYEVAYYSTIRRRLLPSPPIGYPEVGSVER